MDTTTKNIIKAHVASFTISLCALGLVLAFTNVFDKPLIQAKSTMQKVEYFPLDTIWLDRSNERVFFTYMDASHNFCAGQFNNPSIVKIIIDASPGEAPHAEGHFQLPSCNKFIQYNNVPNEQVNIHIRSTKDIKQN